MSRREFSGKVKEAAYERAAGCCEVSWCKAPLHAGKFRYDHIIPDALGGEPTLVNCQVICVPCHKAKTEKHDVPAIAKSKRIIRRRKGIRKPRTITRWRKFNGTEVHASRER